MSTNTTPPNVNRTNFLTLSEMRTIKTQITKAIDVPNFADPSPPRSDEIYALIERWVAKGAEIRKAKNVIDEEWFHPEMQKCIRLQVRIYNIYLLLKDIVSQISSNQLYKILQRCNIAMQTTGVSHKDFFDKLFRLQLFP